MFFSRPIFLKLLRAFCLPVIASLSILGCTGKPPDWIMGTSKRFPDHSYIIGVGRHVQPGDAERLARRQIEKRLGVLSFESSSPEQLHWHALAGADSQEAYLKGFRGALEEIAGKIRPHIRIAEFWEERSTKSLYALAVMDRTKTLEILRRELVEFDSRISSLSAHQGSVTNPLRRLGDLLAAMDELNLRRVVAADIDNLSTRGYAIAAPVSTGELNDRIGETAREVLFWVSLKGPLASSVRGEVVRRMAGLGFSLAPPWAQHLTVTGAVGLEKGGLQGAGAPYEARIQFLENGGGLLGETSLLLEGAAAEGLQGRLAEQIVEALVKHLLVLN